MRTVHSTLLRDDRVLLIAGSGNDPNAFDAGTFKTSIWNPTTNTFTDVPTPIDRVSVADPIGRDYHSSALLLPDRRVVVLGSNPIDGSFELRVSVYAPPYLFQGTGPP